ncbi:TRI16 protein, partial [Polypterus senegalus]
MGRHLKREKRFPQSMASAKEDGVDERTVDIKEEDCERLTPEDVCVKLEDHEERISVFKEEEECKGVTVAIKAEDLNDFSVGFELQKHETEDIFKQEACQESPSSLQLWSTNTGRLANQENSAELKSELSESDEKITEGNEREGEESPGGVKINLQNNGSISPPLFWQPSLHYKEKGMKKSARGSVNLTADFLQCSSLPATGATQKEAIKNDQQQKQLGATQSEIRRRLEEKEKKLRETRKTAEEMKLSVERVMGKHEKSFTDLIHCIEETYKNLTEKIREQEKREIEKAKTVMEQLEKEIEELKRREAELKELSETKDHLHFLQSFSSRCVLPADGDSLSFTVTANFSSEDLLKELSCLKKSLKKISQWDILTWTPPDFCPLTLDINTAHRHLHLSEGNKKVTCEGTKAEYPDHPDRFDHCVQVLCREALTGTRCYWEVECSGRFMKIGVAYKGLDRKGGVWECGLGYNDKSWSLVWSLSQYSVRHNKKRTVIGAPFSPRIAATVIWKEEMRLIRCLHIEKLQQDSIGKESEQALLQTKVLNGVIMKISSSHRLEDMP